MNIWCQGMFSCLILGDIAIPEIAINTESLEMNALSLWGIIGGVWKLLLQRVCSLSACHMSAL